MLEKILSIRKIEYSKLNDYTYENYYKWEEVSLEKYTDKCCASDFAIIIDTDLFSPIYNRNDILLVEKTEHIFAYQVGIFLIDGICSIRKYNGENTLITLSNTKAPLGSECINIESNKFPQGKIRLIGIVVDRI